MNIYKSHLIKEQKFVKGDNFALIKISIKTYCDDVHKIVREYEKFDKKKHPKESVCRQCLMNYFKTL